MELYKFKKEKSSKIFYFYSRFNTTKSPKPYKSLT